MALLFRDTFTDTDSTALQSHTPDTGTGWTRVWGSSGVNISVEANQAEGSGGASDGAIYTADATYGTADYMVKATITDMSIGSDDPIFLLLRVQDQENMYAVGFWDNGTASSSRMYKKVSGTWTALGTAFTTPVDGDVVHFFAMGETIGVAVNGDIVDSVTDSDITSAGKAGLAMGGDAELVNSSDDMASGNSVDNFEVNTIMASPVPGGTDSTSSTRYNTPFVDREETTESDSHVAAPQDMIVKDLYYELITAPGSSASRTVTVFKNGSSTSLSATVSDTDTSGSDTSNMVFLQKGDTISIQQSSSGSPTASNGIFAFTQVGTGQMWVGKAPFSSSSAGSLTPQGANRRSSASSSVAQIPMPTAGTISDFYLYTNTAPGSGTSWDGTVYKNGSSTSLGATISDTATSANDTVDTVSVVAGDDIKIFETETGAAASSIRRFSMLFTPTTHGESVWGGAVDDTLPTTGTEYQGVVTNASLWGASSFEDSRANRVGATWDAKEFRVETTSSPGTGDTWTFTLRKNLADTALSFGISGSATSGSDTGTVTFSSGDKMSQSVAVTGSPTSGRYARWSVLIEEGTPSTDVNITAQDATHSHTADSPAITQTHVIAADDATHSHTADNVTATLDVTVDIAVQDATHAHTADSAAISQTHVIAPVDSTHSHTADNPTISQSVSITPADATHAHTADSPAVTQTHEIAADDSAHSHTADLPSVTQTYSITAHGALHSHFADSSTVTNPSNDIVTVSPDDALHNIISDAATFAYSVDPLPQSTTYVATTTSTSATYVVDNLPESTTYDPD